MEPGEAVKTPGKWGGEDMVGEVAHLEFSFLTTQELHLPGDSSLMVALPPPATL